MNNNAYNAKGSKRAQIVTVVPKQKPAPAPQQPTVVVVPEQKCMKNCCPVLSVGCDLCSNCCGDYYFNPICNSVGITGLLNARPCLVYDEQWGGCGKCIGCEKNCDYNGFCPSYGFGGPYRGGPFNPYGPYAGASAAAANMNDS